MSCTTTAGGEHTARCVHISTDYSWSHFSLPPPACRPLTRVRGAWDKAIAYGAVLPPHALSYTHA